MKRFSNIFITLLAVLLLAALLFAVTGTAAETGGDGEKRTVRLIWEIEAAYPEMPNEAADKTLRDWLAASLDELMTAHQGVMVDPEYPEERLTVSGDYETASPSNGAASVVYSFVSYVKGAAHPMTVIETANIDLESGTLLESKDLFADAEMALEIFAAHAKGFVEESLREQAPDFGIADGDIPWFDDGFAKEWDNYSCLALEPGGVRVIFQRYQILPYVFGNQEAFFPLSLLEPAGPNKKIWPKP